MSLFNAVTTNYKFLHIEILSNGETYFASEFQKQDSSILCKRIFHTYLFQVVDFHGIFCHQRCLIEKINNL